MRMASAEFRLEGLDELMGDLQKVQDDYPDETVKEVYRLAGVFTKDVNEKMPESYADGKNPITKDWHRTKVRGMSGATVAVEVQNTAPHFHLVENGHTVRADPHMYAALMEGKLDHSKSRRKSKSRSKNPKLKDLGFAPGKFYCEKTRDEWDNGEYAGHIRKFVDKLLAKHNL